MRMAAAQGKLRAADLIWRQGFDSWTRADGVSDFAPLVASAPPAPTTTPAAVPATAPLADAASALKPPASLRTNYFSRHWHGDFSLARAYWVNNFGVNLVWVALLATLGLSHWQEELGLRASGLWTLALLIAGVLISIWSMVGVGRSAQAHTARWPGHLGKPRTHPGHVGLPARYHHRHRTGT
jgi:hypothetical protein